MSIKRTERERRSKKSEGRRIKISSANQKAPSSWNDFMKNSENKEDLPEFLLKEWSANAKYAMYLGVTSLFLCHGSKCHRLQVDGPLIKADEVVALECNAEEADTRIFLHAQNVSSQTNAPAIVIRSSDTDVMVLAIFFKRFIATPMYIQRQAQNKRWKYVSVSTLCEKHGADICNALPGFHAYSGCDSTSGFNGKGKKTFFKLLISDASFRHAMSKLGDEIHPSPRIMQACEKAVCKIYKHNYNDVNRVRYDMLTKGIESHDVPPTKDSLILHTERANYQAYIWKNSTELGFLPCKADGHGWKEKEGFLVIHWMTQDPAPKSVLELVSCKNCKKCNTRRCPCRAKGFKCTDSCGCDADQCENCEDSGRHIVGSDEDAVDEDDVEN